MNKELKEECVKARKEIQKLFEEKDVKIAAKTIDALMEKLIDFKVSVDEAKRSVIIQLSKKNDVSVATGTGGTTADAKVHDLKNSMWANLSVTVKELWTPTSDTISQTGLIGDSSGVIKFTIWANAGIETILEEGGSYLLKNIVGNEYQGKVSATLNKTSSIEVLEEEVEIGSTEVTVEGCMVAIKNNSGLIKRCPECTRALSKGACTEHGKVEGVYDIRIMAVIDDGNTPVDVLLNCEVTESLTGKTLQQCIDFAAEELDQGAVLTKFRKDYVGRYFSVTGSDFGQVMVTHIIQYASVDTSTTDELMNKAKEMM